ncbi:MAG: RecQ family ATP-dependent DNA helicase [Firmicutes bacterium]|nr:RecQ family ATP-dependent DNA helicase [Bacillota bacterium]
MFWHQSSQETRSNKIIDIELKEALKSYFGYESFREPQEQIITNILNKKDSIGILPTGKGKSLCYQLPAIFFDNLTIVISPLVALMKDQVDTFNARGVPATSLNSHLTPKQMREKIEEIKEDKYKVIYIAPEKLFSEDFMDVFISLKIDHIAVDEAHCISQWGHDFRPKYKKIGLVLDKLPHRPVISAFTATANERVIDDICKLLKLKEPAIFKTTFDRPNLFIDIKLYEDKSNYVIKYLKSRQPEIGLGLIYSNTRLDAERLSKKLTKEGFKVGLYHAGLTKKERNRVQEEFFANQYQVLVATNAFGMGLDKDNIRFIIHLNMPASIESYYQEIGRGGRDGLPCDCILLFGLKDVMVNRALGKSRVYFKWRLKEKEDWLVEMVKFSHLKSCYKQFVLEHFGEIIEPCGNCGNCVAEIIDVDQTTEAQKVLSAMYHTKGYYGQGTISTMLKGKLNQRIKDKKLDKLSVFGIMKDWTEGQINTLITELLITGYLEKEQEKQEERFLITKKGVEVIKGEAKFLNKVKIV